MYSSHTKIWKLIFIEIFHSTSRKTILSRPSVKTEIFEHFIQTVVLELSTTYTHTNFLVEKKIKINRNKNESTSVSKRIRVKQITNIIDLFVEQNQI